MSKERFLSYGRQEVTEEDVSAVVAVLKGDYLTQGPAVEEFESAFGEKTGAKHAIAVSSGTAGLHIAALAAGLKRGDAAFVPAITFAATANSILYTGATPIFVDVEPGTGCISLSSLEQGLSLAKNADLRPKAIFPVHYAGKPCEMIEVRRLAAIHELKVIEDACHALGAEYLDGSERLIKVGASSSSFATVFSFHPVKHITTGEGGVVTTNDDNIAKMLRRLRSHGITKISQDYVNKELAFDQQDKVNLWYHEMQVLGFNYRLCDIQAALGRSQIGRLSAIVERRREIAKYYREHLAGIEHLRLPVGDGDKDKHSYHLYPLQIDFRALGFSRNEVMATLSGLGIGTQVHYLPVSLHPFYQNNSKLWLAGDLGNSFSFYEQELSIPMYSSLSDADTARVVSAIRNVICR